MCTTHRLPSLQSTWRAREAEERGRKRRAAPPARRCSAVGAGGIGGLGGVAGGGRGKDLWKDEEVFTGNSADNSEEVGPVSMPC